MKTTRPYAQTERRAATERTRTAILDAGLALSREKLSVEIVLSDIAERAGVTVQTVLRHFGTRDGLFAALHEHGTARVTQERVAPVGDVVAGIRVLVDHYETSGDMSLSFLAQERTDERARTVTSAGKALHREWVSTVLGPLVDNDTAAIDELVVVTDVYAWKLLRRDRALSRVDTEHRMLALTRAVIQYHRPTPPPLAPERTRP